MTQEEKQLLIQDLCVRFPYGVKVRNVKMGFDIYDFNYNVKEIKTLIEEYGIMPYLRPLSSMTEEEKKKLKELCDEDLSEYAKFIRDGHGLSHDGLYMFYPLRQLDFINSHHFDFRDLIQNGLALEAPEGMYEV